MNNREQTSFCGLYCGDCIPANERLYKLTTELQKILEKTGFSHYAAFKSNKVPEFKDYDTFIKVLYAFEKLHCYNNCQKGPCSQAGCTSDCKIRHCVIDKRIDGCWDCDANSTCEYIKNVEKFHPDVRLNLAMIKKHGIDNWKEFRGKHYN